MEAHCPQWYLEMSEGQQVMTLNLKESGPRRQLDELLETADLFITANRPAALERLGLGWDSLQRRFSGLSQVAIVGYPPPYENEPGHDLTYQAKHSLLIPPHMPRTLVADMAGAEIAVSEALALLLGRERGQKPSMAMVALSDAAGYMAEPIRVGFSGEGALVGGGLPEYNIYQASDGWIAVAALEPHFKTAMGKALDCDPGNSRELEVIFKTRSCAEWQSWARELDLPVVAVS